ncbi:hypothetical protein D3C78_536540 [compost metagenome]
MDFEIYLAIAAAYTLVLLLIVYHLVKTSWRRYPLLLLLVVFALIYDNAIIALGESIGEGELLQSLSTLRYWMHALFTPCLVLVGWDIARRTGMKWLNSTAAKITAWLITIGLIIYQIIAVTIKEVSDLVPAREYGVLRYMPSGEPGSMAMVIIVGTLLFIGGLIVLFKLRWPWMAIGTAILFVGRAIPIPFESSAITNIYELILIVSLWAAIKYEDRKGII